MNREEWLKGIKEQEEKRNKPLRYRALRVAGYLNGLLQETLPEKARAYEVIASELSDPTKIRIDDAPSYEFYVKPCHGHKPGARVMILHRPDLTERIPGGIKNERMHYSIPAFKENLVRAVQKIESLQQKRAK